MQVAKATRLMLCVLAAHTSVLMAPALAQPALRATAVVGDSAALETALANAVGGDIIGVAPGDYSAFEVLNRQFDSAVTIAPTDYGDPPVFEGPIVILGSEGLIIEGVEVQIPIPDEDQGVVITESTKIVLRNIVVRGAVATDGEGIGLYDGQGIRINDSSGVVVEGSLLTQLGNGLTVGRVDGFELRASQISHIRRDGVVLQDVLRSSILGNFIHSFFPLSGEDHPDMIQFIARSDSEFGIRDLEIRNNIFSQGAGRFVQTIFGKMELGEDPLQIASIEWTRWTVTNNLIVNRQANGIYITDLTDSMISHNTLLPSPNTEESDSPFDGPRLKIIDESKVAFGNSIHSNVFFGSSESYFSGSGYLDEEVGLNAFVSDDEDAPNFYLSLFPNIHSVWGEDPESVPDYGRSDSADLVIPDRFGYRDAKLLGAGPFVDIASSVFVDDIEALAAAGVAQGCNPPSNTQFCPEDAVTRGQMAAFLVRALELPGSSGSGFVDTEDSVFAEDIEALAAAGVTRGCNPPPNTLFCPDDVVTRGQMGAFLVRALELPGSSGSGFVDTEDSVFAEDIEALAAAGVTRGCNPPSNTRFCPEAVVTRGEMAAFLVRGLPAAGSPTAPVVEGLRVWEGPS